jgi:hypothetical protein
LQLMLDELVAVLARCHPSGKATQYGLDAEEEKDGGSFQGKFRIRVWSGLPVPGGGLRAPKAGW